VGAFGKNAAINSAFFHRLNQADAPIKDLIESQRRNAARKKRHFHSPWGLLGKMLRSTPHFSTGKLSRCAD